MLDKLQLTILGGVGIGAALMYVLNTDRKSKRASSQADVVEPVSNNFVTSRIRAIKAAMRKSSLSESDFLSLAMAP